jgi:nucleotide-binding universal stress UspA family protein
VAGKLKRILVGIDGSEYARQAFEVAIGLAAGTSAELYVIIVVQPIQLIGTRRQVRESLMSFYEKEAHRLSAEYGALAKRRGVNIKAIIARGNPAKEILSAADNNGVDMIVVGSRGLGGIKGLLLGSVSNAVVQNSKMPVMVVK